MDAVPQRSRCKTCRKWSYATEMDAWKMIGWMLRSGKFETVPNRVYACPVGNGFHKASKPERDRGYTPRGTKS